MHAAATTPGDDIGSLQALGRSPGAAPFAARASTSFAAP